jgi:hypothetical protein
MAMKGKKIRSGFKSCFSRESLVGFLESSIGNSGAFLVIVPKGINQLGSDERKRLYRISGGILAVERAQQEALCNFLQIQFDIARNFLTSSYNFAHMPISI